VIDIVHRVGIRAPVCAVYAALSTVEGVAAWWTRNASGRSEPGGTIALDFLLPSGERIGGMKMEVLRLDPEREVRWRFREGPEEWIDTEAVFSLSEDDGYTIVNFGHLNWRKAVEFTGHCSTKWATFLLSLKELVETGKGRPSPDDVRIGDWH
jgi:uncharacterized protein YndB with AHSA1/START domain